MFELAKELIDLKLSKKETEQELRVLKAKIEEKEIILKDFFIENGMEEKSVSLYFFIIEKTLEGKVPKSLESKGNIISDIMY